MMTALRTLGTFLVGIATALPLHAQIITTSRSDAASSRGARGITVADLNRDGRPDIITAHNDPDGLVVLTNRGSSYEKWFISIGAGPFDVTSGDLDKDGFPDLAVADADGNNIALLFGMDGGFGRSSSAGAVGKPRGLTIADIDKDGNPDIVYTAYYNHAVQILYGDGTGQFAVRRIPIAVGLNPQGVASADFNMDGWPDLAVASTGSVGLSILYQTPGGTGFTRRDLDVPRAQNVVTVGDFNRDGRPDIAAASTSTADVTVVVNRRDRLSALVYPGGGSPRGIVAADMNRDGAPEIITADRATSTVQVLRANGDGTFGTADVIAAGAGSRTVAVADFDNDGRQDIATGNEYAATATILSNTTTFPRAAYAFNRTVVGGGSGGYSGPNGVTVADFDLDGKYDIVTAGTTSSLVMLRGNGASTPIQSAHGVGTSHAAASFNSDGRPDLLVLDLAPYPVDLSILATHIGDGNGGFSSTKTTQAGVIAFDVKLGDLNRDGRTDAVIIGSTNRTQSSQTRFQSWLGNGDGTFTLASTVTTPRSYTDLDLADIDRDGDLDVITHANMLTTSQPTAVHSWLNDGAGRFPTTPRVAPVAEWDSIRGGTVADVNIDGYVDYVATGYPLDRSLDNGMAVLLGGAAGFGPPTYFSTPEYYSPSPRVADLTMDGRPDILTEDGYLYAGNGDGTFEAALGFDFYAPGLEILDFDRLGLLDIVGPDADGAAQVILNQHRDDNRQPTVTMGPDWQMNYADQFGEGDNDISIPASDPDLHKLVFTVYDRNGNVVKGPSTEMYFTLPARDPGYHVFTVVAEDGRGGRAQDDFGVTILPLKEIVLHTAPQGPYFWGDAWSSVADSTAAGGNAVRDRNAGAPKVNAPLASPSSYAEIYFVADPTQTYKLWVRLKADGNSWANDSLWLQFRGAVDAAGNSYEPGTTSGIAVNLEECGGCGVSGWGWRDESWGQRNVTGTLTLRFTRGGGQILRIQTREDGVRVDQIVLSSEKYRTTRPGTVKNDTVILPWTPFW